MKKLKIGITGGIGSGKSYVSNLLRSRGYKVFDCDSQAKRLMTEDPDLIHKIRQVIGDDAYIVSKSSDGTKTYALNKKLIANYLFKSKENAQLINQIIHPRVALEFQRWAKRQKKTPVFMESAILFESGFNAYVDYSLLVCADIDVRVERAVKRDHVNAEDIRRRMDNQSDMSELREKADFLIYNNPEDNLELQIQELINHLNSIIH